MPRKIRKEPERMQSALVMEGDTCVNSSKHVSGSLFDQLHATGALDGLRAILKMEPLDDLANVTSFDRLGANIRDEPVDRHMQE